MASADQKKAALKSTSMIWQANIDNLKATAANPHVNLRAVLAEFTCMTLFVFIGCGTAVFFSNPKATNFVNSNTLLSNASFAPLFDVIKINSSFGIATAMAFGIGIMVSAFAIGHVSGCHLNPAVTVSLLLSGNCGIGQAIANILSQLCGACVGALLLWGTSGLRDTGLGANSVGTDYTNGNAVLGEIVMTFTLCLVVHLTAIDKNSPPSTNGLAPIAIGFAVFLAHCVLIPLDGCSINPARSFGPALVANKWDNFWVFVVGPLSGAILSVPVFYLLSQPWEAKRDSRGRIVVDEEAGMKITSDV